MYSLRFESHTDCKLYLYIFDYNCRIRSYVSCRLFTPSFPVIDASRSKESVERGAAKNLALLEVKELL